MSATARLHALARAREFGYRRCMSSYSLAAMSLRTDPASATALILRGLLLLRPARR
jgi:hypothetical protein